MTPEKFFDYLEGKLTPPEKERLERALIADPKLQREFVAAREVHRSLERPAHETVATARAGVRGRQLAAAFAVLVALNVGIGLYFIFRSGGPPPEVQKAREEALRQQLQHSLEKSAAAAFSPPTIAPPPIVLTIPAEQQDPIARAVIAAAEEAGGSGTRGLPNDKGSSVFVLVPASAEASFRQKLTAFGAPPPPAVTATPASPDEPVHLEVVLANPR